MKHKNSHLLIGYWGGLSAAQHLPKADMFDDAVINCLAPHLFILDVDDANTIYRLAGSAMEGALGHCLRGTNFLDHWALPDRALVKDFLTLAIRSHRPLCLLSSCGADRIAFETVLIPVALADAREKRIIGIGMALDDAPPAPGRRIQHLMHIGFVHDELAVRARDPIRSRA